jgi:septum formation protein
MSVRRFVLASQSPRRRQILTISGYEFDILPSQISEIPDENLNLTSQIRQLASDKAEACLKMGNFAKGQGILVLASDTVVVLGGQILGKPKDEKEARSFLSRLSNQTHDVITAISLIDVDTGRRVQDHAVTRVTFRELTSTEIDSYVATGDPLDKA